MNFFPTIYEDELLYSVIARYHINSGNTTYRQTMLDVFSDRDVVPSIYLQNNIGELIKNLPKLCSYTESDIIYNSTLYPFYTAFMNNELSTEIYKLMISNKSNYIYPKCGIISSNVKSYDYLMFCPKCIEEEIEKHGIAYWHRTHQISGCLMCIKHKTLLQKSDINKNRYNKYELVTPNKKNCPIDKIEYTSKTVDRIHTLANNIDYIINTKLDKKDKEWFKTNYKNHIKSLNLSSLKGVVRYNSLKEAFEDYYGEELLQILGLTIGEGENNWLRKIASNTSHSNSTIKNLLFIDFLGKTPSEIFNEKFEYNPFGKGPWPCTNKKENHFLKDTTQCISVKYNYQNKCIIGNFKCHCGDEYKLKYLRPFKFEIRENEIRRAQIVENKNFSSIIKKLCEEQVIIDPDLGEVSISRCRCKKKLSERHRKKLDEGIELTRNKHRGIWLELLKQNKSKSKTELADMAISTASWLYKFDGEWFEKNSPKNKQTINNNNLNWKKIDNDTLKDVKLIVEKIYEDDEGLVKLTKRRIGKELNRERWFSNNLKKMPNTAHYVEENVESNQEFRIRKVKHKLRKLYSENEKVTVTKIIGGMVLNTGEKEELVSIIRDELSKLK